MLNETRFIEWQLFMLIQIQDHKPSYLDSGSRDLKKGKILLNDPDILLFSDLHNIFPSM